MKRLSYGIAVGGLLVLLGGRSGTSFARGELETPNPTEAKDPRESEQFLSCRRKVLKLRGGKDPQSKTDPRLKALKACQDLYPIATPYLRCKKLAMQKAEADLEQAKKLVNICRTEFAAAQFQGLGSKIWARIQNDIYFAGVPLGELRTLERSSTSRGSYGNFECGHLNKAIYNKGAWEWSIFGQNLKTWPALKALKGRELVKAIKLSPLQKDEAESYYLSPILGKFYKESSGEWIGYGQVGYCHYARKLDGLYTGAKIYFSGQAGSAQVESLYGVAFFDPSHPKAPSSDQLLSDLKMLIGPKVEVHKNAKGFLYLSATPLKEFDAEGDPKNLCGPTQTMTPILAMISPSKRPNYPQSALVAVPAKTCNFLAAKLAQALSSAGGEN